MKLSDDIPLGLIHYGRDGNDTIDRDYTFYKYTEEYLFSHQQMNTLYINYTGHAGPVAASLSRRNIPIFWQMDLSLDNLAEERVLGQIQDYYLDIANNNGSNNSNIGLLLELQHQSYQTFIPSILPDLTLLKEKVIQRVVIFTEDPFLSIPQNKTALPLPAEIQVYLDSLVDGGLNVEFVGVDAKTRFTGPYHDFECPNKEKIIDLSPYLSNFSDKVLTPTEIAVRTSETSFEDKLSVAIELNRLRTLKRKEQTNDK